MSTPVVELDLRDIHTLSDWPFARGPVYLIAWVGDDLLGAAFLPPVKDVPQLFASLTRIFGDAWRQRVVCSSVGDLLQWKTRSAVTREPVTVVLYSPSGEPDPRTEASVRNQMENDDELIAVAGPSRARARNHGAASARHNVLAFLDDDCEADPSWLSALVDALEPEVDVAAAVVSPERWPSFSTGRDAILRARLDGEPGKQLITQEMRQLAGAGSSIWRRDVLQRLGGFDARVEPADEIDLLRRAIYAGATVALAPDAVTRRFVHAPGGDSRQAMAHALGRGAEAAKILWEERKYRRRTIRSLLDEWKGLRGRRSLLEPIAAIAGASRFVARQSPASIASTRRLKQRSKGVSSHPISGVSEIDVACGKVVDQRTGERRLAVKVDGRCVLTTPLDGSPLDASQAWDRVLPPIAVDLLPWLARPTTDSDVASALANAELPKHPLSPEPRALRPGEVIVAIPTNRGPETCGPLLEELAGTFDVIVLDGSSEPRLREVCLANGARYEHHPATTKAQRQNIAFEMTQSPWVLFLDDDCRLRKQDVRRFADELGGAIDRVPDAGAITGLVVPAELRSRGDTIFELRSSMQRGWTPVVYTRFTFVESTWPLVKAHLMGVGACSCVRREAWQSVDGYDERLGPGTPVRVAEDDGMLADLIDAGWSVFYDPRLIVRHDHSSRRRPLRREFYGHSLGHATRIWLWGFDNRRLGHAFKAWLSLLRHAPRSDYLPRRIAYIRGYLRGAVMAWQRKDMRKRGR